MKNNHDDKLCNRVIRLSIQNTPMPREAYVKRLGSFADQYAPVAVYSALTFLVNHGILVMHKNLFGLSNTQITAAAYWLSIDDALQQAAEGATDASAKGTVQSPS